MIEKNRQIFKFDVAISYAGEEKGLAGDLYRLLLQNDVAVFFAEDYKVYLWGKRLPPALKKIYGGVHTKFVIPIISKHYVKKFYTKLEFRTAKRKEKSSSTEVILPIILDNVSLKGLESDRNYIDLRKEGLHSTVDIIIKKLRPYMPPPAGIGGLFYEKSVVPTFWVATFGITIEDLLKNPELPSFAPRDYVAFCDWIEKDLMGRISKSPIKKYNLIEDMRTGETFSVRIAFEWNPDEQPLDFGNIAWWEVLEIARFEDIYPSERGKEFLNIKEMNE